MNFDEMPEIPPLAKLESEVTPVDQARMKHELALNMLFSAYGSSEKDKHINLTEEHDLAEETIFALFDSGAELHQLEAQEKLKSVVPYSDEALAIQKEADQYQKAAEYIHGYRVTEGNRQVAMRIYDQYRTEALTSIMEYVTMKEKDVKRVGILRRKDRIEEAAADRIRTSYYTQYDRANSYIRKNYNLEYNPAEEDMEKKPEDLAHSTTHNPAGAKREK